MLPSLSVLRSFEAASKHESYTDAAEELGISQAVVSRQVRELEGTIGHQLFRKEGRGVALTSAGRGLAADLHVVLSQLRQVIDTARGAGETGQSLAVAVLPTFSSRWLARRLPGFRDENPGVQLTLKSRSEPVDLLRERVDVAIHFGAPDWIGGKHTPLCPEALVAVAAPKTLDAYEIERPQDSVRLPLLHLASRRDAWPAFFQHLGLEPRLAYQGDVFDQFATIINAAVAGLGAVIVPVYLVEVELAEGTLVTFGRPDAGNGRYYAVTPNGVANPLAERFCKWIARETQMSTKSRHIRA